tara:strand:- start:313 stop:612 length:300 start_codon:yes stop_codon:yes gene_type:complete
LLINVSLFLRTASNKYAGGDKALQKLKTQKRSDAQVKQVPVANLPYDKMIVRYYHAVRTSIILAYYYSEFFSLVVISFKNSKATDFCSFCERYRGSIEV